MLVLAYWLAGVNTSLALKAADADPSSSISYDSNSDGRE